jgi:hypothetical protein
VTPAWSRVGVAFMQDKNGAGCPGIEGPRPKDFNQVRDPPEAAAPFCFF